MPVIEVRDLVKDYRTVRRLDGPFGAVRTLFSRQYDLKRAVDGVDFSIEPGELVGYLGPNGAGKSTTIKMMTGVLVPTSGEVLVGGVTPWRNRERNALQIGAVFGQRSQLWWDLPLRDSFELVRKLYRIPVERYRRNLDQFVDLLDMGEFIGQPVRQLSLGQRMRGDFAASMLHEPPVLYLDEPTIGLDVVARENIRLFIEQINRDNGTTVVLTTHDIADVERLCRRIIIIDHGRVVYDGAVEELKARYVRHRVLVVRLVPNEDGASGIVGLELPGVELIGWNAEELRIRFTDETSAQDVIAAVNRVCRVADLSIVEPDLEGVVRQIYIDREPAL